MSLSVKGAIAKAENLYFVTRNTGSTAQRTEEFKIPLDREGFTKLVSGREKRFSWDKDWLDRRFCKGKGLNYQDMMTVNVREPRDKYVSIWDIAILWEEETKTLTLQA